MAVQNPIMDILRSDRSVENLGAAAKTGSLASQSFQQGASMAMKMDQLLKNEEDRVYNRTVKAQEMLQKGMMDAFTMQFKKDTLTQNQSQFDTTQAQKLTEFNALEKFRDDTRENRQEQNVLTAENRRLQLANQAESTSIARDTLNVKKKQIKDTLKLKTDAIKFTADALGGTKKGAPKTLNNDNLTASENRESLNNEIMRLTQLKSNMKAFPAQAAQFDNKIKVLQNKYKKYAPVKADVDKWLQLEFKENPDMTPEEYTSLVESKVNSEDFYSAADKKLYSTEGGKAYEKFRKNQQEGHDRYTKLSSQNNADRGTDEYKINDALALMSGRDKSFAQLVEKGFEDTEGQWINQDALADGITPWGDDEIRAGKVLTYMQKTPELKKILDKEAARQKIKISALNKDQATSFIRDVLKNNDLISTALKYN